MKNKKQNIPEKEMRKLEELKYRHVYHKQILHMEFEPDKNKCLWCHLEPTVYEELNTTIKKIKQ